MPDLRRLRNQSRGNLRNLFKRSGQNGLPVPEGRDPGELRASWIPTGPDTYLSCVRTSPTKKSCRRLTLYQSASPRPPAASVRQKSNDPLHANALGLQALSSLLDAQEKTWIGLEAATQSNWRVLPREKAQQPNDGCRQKRHRSHEAEGVEKDLQEGCLSRVVPGRIVHPQASADYRPPTTVPLSGFPSTRATSPRPSRPCSLRPPPRPPAGKSGPRRRRRRRLPRPRCRSRDS